MTFNDNSADRRDKCERDRVSKIVDYWNSALLSSRTSSTSHANPHLSDLDNAIENRVLLDILRANAEGRGRSIDIGAGYGRFVPTFKVLFKEIVLLEAAQRIYDVLASLWNREQGIECILSDFESFADSREYDLIFASGLLYLYDDRMVHGFLRKCRSISAKRGLVVLRDFIADPARVSKSAYVQGGQCHYRTCGFWNDAAISNGLEIVEVRKSRPRLGLLRKHWFLRLLRYLRVSAIVSSPYFVNAAMKMGDWRLSGPDTQTVFIVMRAL